MLGLSVDTPSGSQCMESVSPRIFVDVGQHRDRRFIRDPDAPSQEFRPRCIMSPLMSAVASVAVEGLVHHYGRNPVLRGIDFTVREAEIFALLGPNGGGKTTLFRILATLIRPAGGRALIQGHDVTLRAADVRRAIGVVFQSPALDRRLTV